MSLKDVPWDEESAACERALEALVFGEPIDPDNPSDVERWLDASGVRGPSRGALTAQLRYRLPVYRKLVHERVSDALRTMLPRTSEMLANQWSGLVEEFLRMSGPQSPILREVLAEWVKWARDQRERRLPMPEFIFDFMLFESLQIEVAALGTIHPGSAPEHLDAETPLQRHPAARLGYFDYAVHQPSVSLDLPPRRTPTALLVYCDAQYEHHWLEMGTFAASLWRCLEVTLPLGQAVSLALISDAAHAQAPSLEAVSSLLADFCERGLIVSQSSSV